MARKRAASPNKKSHPGWIVLAVIIGITALGGLLGRVATPVFVIVVILAAALGLFTIIKGATPRLGMRSRKTGFATLGVAALLVLGGGVANANPTDKEQPPSAAALISSTVQEAASMAERATPTPTPMPTTFEEVDVDSIIPFDRTTVDDPTVSEGTTVVSTAGVNGTKRTTYKVTYVDGREVARDVVSETIAVEPVHEVTTRGTLKPQPAPAPPPAAKPVPLTQPSGDCDPNYTGACVPIASDVDCGGGSGDGPAYLDGTARVVGTDIYKLDRDKNGVACD
ncbi:G5 domain-containing protein [Microbacterium alcoholitolerans]|uniref:G5 domain-containing protein n=1 Tax=unclassified Microbacterium TaxID=2609290 RepID=UPI003D17DE81